MLICNRCNAGVDDSVDLDAHVRIEHPVYYKLVKKVDKLEVEKIIALEELAQEGLIGFKEIGGD